MFGLVGLVGLVGLLGAISYNPIVRIHLGPLAISPHGVGIAVGFLLGARYMLPRTRAKGIEDDVIYPLFTRAAIGAIVGARLAYVVNHSGDFNSFLEVFQVWKGGISLIGGMFGALLFTMPKMKSSRLSFWRIVDCSMPGTALGVTVGRIGDLIVGDHLGKTTHFFLGYRCPDIGVATASPCAPTAFASRTPGAVVHQTALYDLMLAAVLLAVLLWFERRGPRYDGFLVYIFGIGYGVARLIEDFLREDLRHYGLTGSQWAALVTMTVCLFMLLVKRRTPKWARWDEPAPAAVAAASDVSSPAPSPDMEPEPSTLDATQPEETG